MASNKSKKSLDKEILLLKPGEAPHLTISPKWLEDELYPGEPDSNYYDPDDLDSILGLK